MAIGNNSGANAGYAPGGGSGGDYWANRSGGASAGGGGFPAFTSDDGLPARGYGYYNGGPGAAPQTGNAGVDAIMAGRPGYLSPMDQNGNLYDNFKMKKNPSLMGQVTGGLGKINNSGVTSNFKMANGDLADMNKMAHSAGLSPYAQAQMSQLDGLKYQGLNNAGAAATAATHGAMDNMAMHGGLSAGAAERLSASGGNNALNARQNVYQQDAQNRAGVGTQDAGFKQGLLQNMPGMASNLAGAENQVGMSQLGMSIGQGNFEGQQNLGVQGQNLGTKLGAMGGENDFNQNVWGKGADVYGQGQVADAMTAQANKPNPGLLGGGGVLGTGISSPGNQWQKFFGGGGSDRASAAGNIGMGYLESGGQGFYGNF